MSIDQEKVRKYATIADVFAMAMGQDYDVTITPMYGPDITGRAVRRTKAPVMSGAGLRLTVRLPDGQERGIHLADVRAIERADK